MKRVRSFLPTGVEVSLLKPQCSRRIALCFATLEIAERERGRERGRERERASKRASERARERERVCVCERERESPRHCLTCVRHGCAEPGPPVSPVLHAQSSPESPHPHGSYDTWGASPGLSDTESESDDELTPSQDGFLKRQRQPSHVEGPAREDGKARAANGGKGLGRASKAGKESSRKPQSCIHNTGLSHLFWVIVLVTWLVAITSKLRPFPSKLRFPGR